jgi:hypothetical protein
VDLVTALRQPYGVNPGAASDIQNDGRCGRKVTHEQFAHALKLKTAVTGTQETLPLVLGLIVLVHVVDHGRSVGAVINSVAGYDANE